MRRKGILLATIIVLASMRVWAQDIGVKAIFVDQEGSQSLSGNSVAYVATLEYDISNGTKLSVTLPYAVAAPVGGDSEKSVGNIGIGARIKAGGSFDGLSFLAYGALPIATDEPNVAAALGGTANAEQNVEYYADALPIKFMANYRFRAATMTFNATGGPSVLIDLDSEGDAIEIHVPHSLEGSRTQGNMKLIGRYTGRWYGLTEDFDAKGYSYNAYLDFGAELKLGNFSPRLMVGFPLDEPNDGIVTKRVSIGIRYDN